MPKRLSDGKLGADLLQTRLTQMLEAAAEMRRRLAERDYLLLPDVPTGGGLGDSMIIPCGFHLGCRSPECWSPGRSRPAGGCDGGYLVSPAVTAQT